MDFAWSEDQRLLKEGARKFAQKNQTENINRFERSSRFPFEQWKKFSEFGVLKLTAPKSFNGMELDLLSCISVMEGLGKGTNDYGLLFSLNTHLWGCVESLLEFGSNEQKEKYLPRLLDGTLIGALAMTEPDSGSDAFGLKTSAIDHGDHYEINGSKVFSTNGNIADLVMVFVKMKESGSRNRISCLIVENDTSGFNASDTIEKMGLRTSPFCQLFFDQCRVSKENLLGQEGMGELIFNHIMDGERVCILATQIGVMEKQLETCLKYSRTRKQFGQAIFNYQSISNLLADMKVNLETSRLIIYKVAWQKMNEKNSFELSAIAKLHVNQCSLNNSISAMKIFGGWGYTTEYEVERHLRDSLGCMFSLGTPEIMRNIISQLID